MKIKLLISFFIFISCSSNATTNTIQVDKKYLVANKEYLETRLSNYYKKTLLPLNDDNKFNEFIYLNYSQDIHLYQELIKRYISKPLKLSLLI